jgi:hypothetical protein
MSREQERPAILKRLEQQLLDKGYDASTVEKQALQFLQNAGILDSDGNLTDKGKERDAMTPEQRAITRASKKSGRPYWHYYYDYTMNKAKLREHTK